jgi:hypothetical protein
VRKGVNICNECGLLLHIRSFQIEQRRCCCFLICKLCVLNGYVLAHPLDHEMIFSDLFSVRFSCRLTLQSSRHLWSRDHAKWRRELQPPPESHNASQNCVLQPKRLRASHRACAKMAPRSSSKRPRRLVESDNDDVSDVTDVSDVEAASSNLRRDSVSPMLSCL